MKVPLFLLSTLLLLLSAMTAHSALTLNINTADKTYFFTGSDTGVAGDDIGFGTASWYLSDIGIIGGGSHSVEQTSNFPFTSSSNALEKTILTSFGSTSDIIAFEIQFNGPFLTTVSGTNDSYSYASMDSTGQMRLEAVIGMSLPLRYGTGFSSISVVPEPSSWAVIGGALAIGLLFWRRRRIG